MEQQTTFIPDGMNAFERNVKRVGDCMIAGILMIIFSPLFLACYIAVKREDEISLEGRCRLRRR